MNTFLEYAVLYIYIIKTSLLVVELRTIKEKLCYSQGFSHLFLRRNSPLLDVNGLNAFFKD
jgi:hypothetical protein